MDELLRKNPLRALRKRLDMSQREFACALGVSEPIITDFELGGRPALTPKILEGLRQLGEDAEAIAKEYEAWFRKLREHYVRLARQRGAGGV